MRIALLVCFVIACSSGGKPADKAPPGLDVHVDRRVELMAILQRLAGAKEYAATPASVYVAAVDAQFAPFKEHPAVVATAELRTTKSISFDAPMWLAVQLDDALKLRGPPGDARWNDIDVEAYLVKVRDFATASGLDAFLAKHRDYFARVEKRLRDEIAKENPGGWFDEFFGKRPEARFVVVPGMLIGQRNFGPYTATELYQILGVTRLDFDELPTFDTLMLELVVHEMAHSYINPLFARHQTELAPHGERLFAQVGDAMKKQAYATWQIVMNEQGVRAVTVLYLQDRNGDAAGDAAIASPGSAGARSEANAERRLIEREVARSFIWTRPLVAALREYKRSRREYPDLEAYMARMITHLASAP